VPLVRTSRFGEIEARDDQIYTFPEGLPGIEAKTFVLLDQWLQATDKPDVALILADPYALVPDLELSPRLEELRVIDPGDGKSLVWRVIVSRGPTADQLTLNLFAPVVLNPAKRLGMQVPLVGSSFGTKEVWPLVRTSSPEAGSDTVVLETQEAP
jgi:flagellar assembly factor FliW